MTRSRRGSRLRDPREGNRQGQQRESLFFGAAGIRIVVVAKFGVEGQQRVGNTSRLVIGETVPGAAMSASSRSATARFASNAAMPSLNSKSSPSPKLLSFLSVASARSVGGSSSVSCRGRLRRRAPGRVRARSDHRQCRPVRIVCSWSSAAVPHAAASRARIVMNTARFRRADMGTPPMRFRSPRTSGATHVNYVVRSTHGIGQIAESRWAQRRLKRRWIRR